MIESKIPVRNIFYLLAYAWDQLKIAHGIQIGTAVFAGPADFFARILCLTLESAKKSGLAQGYITCSEQRTSPKGKFDLSESIKSGSIQRNSIACHLDQLTYDILENQILKASITTLLKSSEIHRDLKDQLQHQLSFLCSVSDILIQPKLFKSIAVPRQKSSYRLMLSVCELLHYSLLPEESERGEMKFSSFLRDEKLMPKVFESFVRNFYKNEQNDFPIVGAPHVSWDAVAKNGSDLSLLPAMLTDTTLESPSRVIIIDTKFYSQTLSSFRGGNGKVQSPHLYQLMSYITNKAKNCTKPVEGILLYPTTNATVSAEFTIQGHRIRVCTVDLSKPWQEIEAFLLTLIRPAADHLAQVS